MSFYKMGNKCFKGGEDNPRPSQKGSRRGSKKNIDRDGKLYHRMNVI